MANLLLPVPPRNFFQLRPVRVLNLVREIKKAYLAPYQDFEAQVKELLAMVDAPLDEIKTFVSEMAAGGTKAVNCPWNIPLSFTD